MIHAPAPGEYQIGDEATDGHQHKLVVGIHVLDQENPVEGSSLYSGDFPRATANAFVYTDTHVGRHAHTMTVDQTTGELICSSEKIGRYTPHTHTTHKLIQANENY